MGWKGVPWLLILFRLVAGPAVLALAWTIGPPARIACASLLALGVLSDIFDGVIARRIGAVTPALRTWDSRTDVVFWVSVVAGALVLHPGLGPRLVPLILTLAALELTAHAVSYLRFRKEASPHHLLSKLFGLGLWLLMSLFYLRGDAGWLLYAVFALGVLSQLEALAIMLILPAWRADVKSFREALALRSAQA
jgi:CDP-diacylglycerol--glycerol-3-phosphate 3-phosphatidyltransferase